MIMSTIVAKHRIVPLIVAENVTNSVKALSFPFGISRPVSFITSTYISTVKSQQVTGLCYLAKIVVNPIHRFLVEYAVHHFIQYVRRFQVPPEGLFQNNSRPPLVAAGQSHPFSS